MAPDAPEPTDEVAGIAIEEHLTIVRIGGELRDRLLDTLEGAGWRAVRDDDLPSPDPDLLDLPSLDAAEAELAATRQLAELADAELAETLAELAVITDELERSERRRAELDGLADLVTQEWSQARHVDESTERLSRIVEGAAGLGFDECVPVLATWIEQIASGTAARHPLASELTTRRDEIARALEDGEGSVDRAPSVLAAHARRHELRSLIVELEGMVERGLTAESRHQIETAHAERVQTEEAGRRRGQNAARDALAAEDAVLARFGYASFIDFQIATSTRSVGEHAEATLVDVQAELQAADRDLAAAEEAALRTRAALEAESAQVEAAIAELAAGRSLDGVLARPDAVEQLGTLVANAAAGELEHADEQRARQAELQPIVDARTQAAAAAEGDVEAAEAAVEALRVRHVEAAELIEHTAAELRSYLLDSVADGSLIIRADVAWLPGDRVEAMLEEIAVAGPVVWSTERPDLRSSRAVESPRWWQFRRRARQAAHAAG